jgi:pimeloyl-ACP methyl ester carboxylesterase
VALQLAARGRATAVVALAPAGGWAPGDTSYDDLLALQTAMHASLRAAAPHADAIAASPEGRRRATQLIATSYEHIPADLIAHLIRAGAAAAASELLAYATRSYWTLDAERIDCPVRIVWGTADRLLPWPSAAVRYRTEWLPQADWVELDGVGHCPQLDVPLETSELILGFTA